MLMSGKKGLMKCFWAAKMHFINEIWQDVKSHKK